MACGLVIVVLANPALADECEVDTESALTALKVTESSDSDADATTTPVTREYTWTELREAIPGLRRYELDYGANEDDEGCSQPVFMLCARVSVTGSRIKRRQCQPLQDYLDWVVSGRASREQRQVAIDILSRPTVAPPPSTISISGVP